MSSPDRHVRGKPLGECTMATRSEHAWTTISKPAGHEVVSEVVSASTERPKNGILEWFKKQPRQECTLQTSPKHGWKPETMHAPVLLAFAAASLLIAILIEVLAQKSQRSGGLSLVKDANSLSAAVTFGYLYLPTIIAVMYSLAWNWVDLDVKRMQPWLELSREAGAMGHNSLFLDYPFDFVAFVPFKAAKRRHWAVFYSGTVMTLIFFLITPLQSAIFGAGEVLVKKPATVQTSTTFMDPVQQAEQLDQSVLNTGYAITWINQPYPPFTTSEYALMPFEAKSTSTSLGPPANWTGVTTKYWTELECWPASMSQAGEKTIGTASFDNGRGCNARGVNVITAVEGYPARKMHYIGYQNSAYSQFYLASSTCNKSAWHQFLAIWADYDGTSSPAKMQGIFCETSYFKQKVTASIRAKDKRPIDSSIKPLSDAETLREAEFNSSALEHLMTAGVSSVTKLREYPFAHLVEHSARLNHTGLRYPLSPMIGFALGGQNYTFEEYSNTSAMNAAFRAAHKSIFSIAFSQVVVNSTTRSSSEGDLYYTSYGVIVSRVFSGIIEGFLCFVAVLALLLLRTSRSSPSMLSSDPGSLEALVDLVHNSESLLKTFVGKDILTDEQLRKTLGDLKFQLQCGCQNPNDTALIKLLSPETQDTALLSESNTVTKSQAANHAGHYSPMKPIPLQRPIGAVFTSCLLGGLVTIVVLKKQEEKLGGLSPPSRSFEVNLILTSFLPTIFATLVEPFWVLLNRLLCILQPFQDLWSKQRAADTSLKARYTAVPPQLALIGAIKSGHFFLAGLCVIALLANVLAVGLGGLFNDAPKIAVYPTTLLPIKNASFSDEGIAEFFSTIFAGRTGPYGDPYYVVMANLSSGTPLPPWTSPEFTFLPVNLTSDAKAGANNFTARTVGFGAEPSCISLGSIVSVDEPPVLDASFGKAGPIEGCPSEYQPPSMFLDSTMYSMPTGGSSAEVVDTMGWPYNLTECDSTLIFGWSRSDISNRTGTMNSSFVVCHPVINRATFDVSFDSKGYIQKATRVSEFSTAPHYPNSTTHYQLLIQELNHSLQDQSLPWHNDTISRNWLGYLLKLQAGNPALLDPAAGTPEANAMLQPVTKLYKLIFATFLSLNRYTLEDANSNAVIHGTQSLPETRIFLSLPALIASLTVLSLYIIAAVVFYGWGVKLFLPRMPTTIGSLIAYVAPSRFVHEYSEKGFEKGQTFGFGRFVGDDGRAHIGIEFSDRIVPLKLSTLERGDTMPVSTTMGRLWHRARSKKDGDVWL